jgi:hypothetical protein
MRQRWQDETQATRDGYMQNNPDNSIHFGEHDDLALGFADGRRDRRRYSRLVYAADVETRAGAAGGGRCGTKYCQRIY